VKSNGYGEDAEFQGKIPLQFANLGDIMKANEKIMLAYSVSDD